MGALKVTEQHSYNPHIVIYSYTYIHTYMFHRIWIGICHSGCLLLKTEPFCPGWFDTTYIHTCIYHTYIIHTYIHTYLRFEYLPRRSSFAPDRSRPPRSTSWKNCGGTIPTPPSSTWRSQVHTYIHTYIHTLCCLL